ncbi:MAG: acido-empty-quinoprotein group A [Candidatus Solibacter sp.]
MNTKYFLALGALTLVAQAAFAQGTTQAILAKPPKDSWPSYHGDYTGQRHSALTQITPQNVKNLTLAWAYQSGANAQIKASPLLVDGVIYFSTPDNVYAVDARNGRQIWHYTYPANKGFHIGSRGVSMYGDWLYFMTPDSYLICLNAKDGTVRWKVQVADAAKGYWTTMSPLIIRNHVLVGVSGDFDNLTGFVRSVDPENGKTQWKWDSTPPAGTPNTTTGGMTWMTGTYDPETDTVFWGTGNPTPVLNGASRPGNNPDTCSIVALDPNTGTKKWAFQASPHDTHDWDAVEIPVLANMEFGGRQRKLLMQASRNGYFFVLDRETGEGLVSKPFGPVNWSLGVDKKGQPIPNPAKDPASDGRLIAPDEGGLTNYRSPSFDPKTGLFLVSARPSYGIYFNKPADGAFGWAGADYGVWSKGEIQAIDYKTGNAKWVHDLGGNGSGAGILTTESGLAFTGDGQGNVMALRTSDGKTLWHAMQGQSMQSSPITYELDGRQYLITSGGGVMFAWALPED